MPFNVIIADDEYFIRQRLIKLIPWEELDFTLIGEVENGLQVLDLLSTHTVHLIILDIQMPKMTGIEVSHYIHEHYPHIKTVILSGYNEFEYAQQTLRFGAIDYLLKPVNSETLVHTLKQCKQKIALEQTTARTLKKYHHYEKQTQLYNCLNDINQLTQLYRYYPELKSYPFSTFVGCFISETNAFFINHLKDYLKQHTLECEYFKESESHYVFQVFLQYTAQHQELLLHLEHFVASCKAYLFISYGDIFYIQKPWKAFYQQTLAMLNQRFFHPNSYVMSSPHSNSDSFGDSSLSKIRQKLTSFINSKNEYGLCTYMKECFEIVSKKADASYLQLVLNEIILTYKIYYPQLLPIEVTSNEFISTLLEEEYSLSHIKQAMLTYGLQCLNGADTLPSDVIISQKIIRYIEQHYDELDLSVSKISDFLGLNPSYIGTLFKKVNNQSILQYMTLIRLEASKRLLETQKYKVSEVSEMVGYSDVFYYSKRFKKMYGYSPKEYSTLNTQSL